MWSHLQNLFEGKWKVEGQTKSSYAGGKVTSWFFIFFPPST